MRLRAKTESKNWDKNLTAKSESKNVPFSQKTFYINS